MTVKIVLEFPDEANKDNFISQLYDGFGENYVEIHELEDYDYLGEGQAVSIYTVEMMEEEYDESSTETDLE